MDSWQSAYIKANGIQLHYTRTGGAKPPLVLAHGVTDDGLCWTPIAEALAAPYDVIMVDARGHGLSDAPEQGYGPATQADDLSGVITGLGLPHPIVLGHSMGAITTLALAGTYPDVPGAILLEDPPEWWLTSDEEETEVEAERTAQMRAGATEIKRKTREQLIAAQQAEMPGSSQAELGPWAEAKLRFSLNVLDIFKPGTGPSVNWSALLPRITCPVLLITADPTQGALVTAEGAAALKALIPQLHLAPIPTAGHSIRRDQFAPYLKAVQSFLTEI